MTFPVRRNTIQDGTTVTVPSQTRPKDRSASVRSVMAVIATELVSSGKTFRSSVVYREGACYLRYRQWQTPIVRAMAVGA